MKFKMAGCSDAECLQNNFGLLLYIYFWHMWGFCFLKKKKRNWLKMIPSWVFSYFFESVLTRLNYQLMKRPYSFVWKDMKLIMKLYCRHLISHSISFHVNVFVQNATKSGIVVTLIPLPILLYGFLYSKGKAICPRLLFKLLLLWISSSVNTCQKFLLSG